MKLSLFLTLLSGIAWTIVYIDCIRLGFRDKTYGMPFWALALNIAWEVIYSFLGLKNITTSAQESVNIAWFLLDCAILVTYFRYGYKEFPKAFSLKTFYAWGISGLICSLLIQHQFYLEFGDYLAETYSAFLQNLLMAVLFIDMLVKRNSSKGQSMLIAVSKMAGTAAPTILFGCLDTNSNGKANHLALLLGILIFVVDSIYVALLYRIIQKEKAGPKTTIITENMEQTVTHTSGTL